ncbi:hypothetical protein [Chryseobacterium salviniae]|uniref:Uncharacterized protein n=1 Tax=Chryseobacterium salviniae TaxID=3101750 RepID=A0ABU6HTQ9_9FLAO|nr:hypothetical protein [Chryseobacterium sp. T9W2-O]MEC3875302.1 hypothetical protein [Chryseobacterium sp. T9W2-O]
MEKIKSDSVYITLKSIVYVLAIMGLIFFANFWLGTQDGFEDIVENEFYPALITRTLFLTTIGLFFLVISYFLSAFYKKKYNYFKELLVLILFSLMVNLYVMLF